MEEVELSLKTPGVFGPIAAVLVLSTSKFVLLPEDQFERIEALVCRSPAGGVTESRFIAIDGCVRRCGIETPAIPDETADAVGIDKLARLWKEYASDPPASREKSIGVPVARPAQETMLPSEIDSNPPNRISQPPASNQKIRGNRAMTFIHKHMGEMSTSNSQLVNIPQIRRPMDRMGEMNRPPTIDYGKRKPRESGEAKPWVAAAIVFSPIVVSVILLILYVLFSKK